MRGRIVTCVVLCAIVAGPASAATRQQAITGKLSRSGYTVIAVAAGGQVNAVLARRGSFSVRPPAALVTLHLRAPSGSYAGPIVVGRDRTRAILGVKAGTHLGAIRIDARRGYAKPVHRLARRWLDRSRWGRARGGVPIGAGNFGRVRSTPPAHRPPGDRDADGIANPFDVDDDGDLVLDDVERHATGRANIAQAQPGALTPFTLLYEMGNATFPPGGPLSQPVNIDSGMDPAAIEATLVKEGKLSLGDSSHQYVSGELDCGGLSYCSAGGTGLREPPGGNSVFTPEGTGPFPACCDTDGNGLGAFDVIGNGALSLFLHPQATSDKIRAGDVFVLDGTCVQPCAADGSTKLQLAGSLASVFATVPAIASYTDELGVTHELHYPLTPTDPTFPFSGSPGSQVAIVDGPDAGTDVSVKLAFWRPQRRALPEEVAAGQSEWIDMGGLLMFAHSNGGAGTTWCPGDAYSDVDPALAPAVQSFPANPEPVDAAVFLDQAKDQPAAPANTFSYTLDVTRCLTAHGESFGPGGRAAMIFDALLPPSTGQPVNFVEAGYAFYNATPPSR